MISDLITSSLPKFFITRPTTNTKLWFRPILVKEEKKLLAIQELGRKEEIVKAVQEVLNSCYTDIDSSKLPTFEFDYLFVQLRCKSISEMISAKLTCPYTEEKINFDLNLNSIKINGLEKYKSEIKISDNLIIKFKLPTYEDTFGINTDNILDDTLLLASRCVFEILTPEENIQITESNRKDVLELFNNLTPVQFGKIIEYFNSIPTYQHIFEYKTSDGEDRKVVISGIEDFFTLALAT